MTDLRKDLETRVSRLAAELRALTQTLERLNSIAPDDPDLASVVIPMGTPMCEVERRLIVATLAWTNFNKTATADALGISRRSVYNKIAELGGAQRCARCDATAIDGVTWPLPNLCQECSARIEAERQAAARQKVARLSDAGAAAVLRRAASGESLVALAEEYNVPPGVVRRLVRGLSFRHLPRPELAVQVPRATLAGEVAA